MKMHMANLTVDLRATSRIDTVLESIRDLDCLIRETPKDVLEGIKRDIAGLFPDQTILADDMFDLVSAEPVDRAASWASQIKRFKFNPRNRYIVLFATIAAQGQHNIFWRHGWPVLSLESGSPSMTEGAGANNPGAGGAA